MEIQDLQVKEETGFSAIEMLLCIIIVLMIGFIGLYVYHTQKATNDTYASASKIASAPTPKVTKKPTMPAATSSTVTSSNYLDIKEWGVKIPLTGSLSDLTYGGYNSYSSNGDPISSFEIYSSVTSADSCQNVTISRHLTAAKSGFASSGVTTIVGAYDYEMDNTPNLSCPDGDNNLFIQLTQPFRSMISE